MSNSDPDPCRTYVLPTTKRDNTFNKTYNSDKPDAATNLVSLCVLSIADILSIMNTDENMFFKKFFCDKILSWYSCDKRPIP